MPALQYMKHEMWKPLFQFYNDHHEKKLQMGCGPCYIKVLSFIKKEIESDLKNGIDNQPPIPVAQLN